MGTGRLAVVGAGLAGLAALQDLKAEGYTVELFERTRLLGGKATSFSVGGVEVDNGQHVYLACCGAFIDFAERAGALLDDDAAGPPLWLQPRFEALLLARDRSPARLRAVPLPAPLHLLPGLLGYRHLGLGDRLSIARAMLAARQPVDKAETFAGWLDRHGQSAATWRAFWEPFLIPALNAPLDRVSAASALFVITTAFLDHRQAGRIGYARVPLGRLAEAAARAADRVHLRTPVAAIDVAPAPGGALALRGLVLGDGERRAYDGVVLAVPPGGLARLLGDPDRFGVSGLAAFETAPIVDVHLWYDLPPLGFGFAALLDSPVQWVFEKAPGYLCCSLSAADELLLLPEARLIERCHAELAAVLPELRAAKLIRGAATRDREATFVPAPGLHRPGPITACPQVTIAGAWTDTGWPATMESAVRSGRAAARALAANLARQEEVSLHA